MSLSAVLDVRRPGFRLDAALEIAAGEVLALLGPNGAGKTTTVRALAGLDRLTAGHVTADGMVLEHVGHGVRLPPQRRPLGVVFQDDLLFPHLNALDNVAFGPWVQGAERRLARARAGAWLERLGLGGRTHARPRDLSGGEARRVSLARALVLDAPVLLLDEPLAALDAATVLAVRAELGRHLGAHAGATLLVTHDPADMLVLADRLVVLEGGRVVQQGNPAEVARAPRTQFVARLVGLNLHRGRADGSAVHLGGGVTLTVATAMAGDVLVAFAPAAVSLHHALPAGSSRDSWPARVVGLEPYGDTVRVSLDAPPAVRADVTLAAAHELQLRPDAPVEVAVDAAQVRAYPP